MIQKYTLEGTFWNNLGKEERKTFEFEIETTDAEIKANQVLLGLLKNPWRLITEGKKYGITGLTRFVLISALFVFLNLIFAFVLLYELVFNEATKDSTLLVLGIVLFGLTFSIIAIQKAYRFMVIDVFKALYANNPSFFKSICRFVVDRGDELVKSNPAISNESFESALNLSSLFASKFKGMPMLMQKMFRFIINRLPFSNSVVTLINELKSQDKNVVADNLYVRVDAGIKESVFDKNTTNWAFWLFTLNLVIQVLLLSKI